MEAAATEEKIKPKTKIIRLRITETPCDQALLNALNECFPKDSGCERSLSNKVSYFLQLFFGIRPMQPDVFEHLQDILLTQRERFPKKWDYSQGPPPWPAEQKPVENKPVRNGLRLVSRERDEPPDHIFA